MSREVLIPIFGKIFEMLAQDPTEQHKEWARKIWEIKNWELKNRKEFEFEDEMMCCGEALEKLGLTGKKIIGIRVFNGVDNETRFYWDYEGHENKICLKIWKKMKETMEYAERLKERMGSNLCSGGSFSMKTIKNNLVSKWDPHLEAIEVKFVTMDEEGETPWFSLKIKEEEVIRLMSQWAKILSQK